MTADRTTTEGARYSISHLTESSFSTDGRREFVAYRDLGVEAATGGQMGATVARLTGEGQATGWHYHTCDFQFFYVLNGWLEVEIEGSGLVRLETGGCAFLSKGTLHNELRTSPDIEVLEITLPAAIGTVKAEAPA